MNPNRSILAAAAVFGVVSMSSPRPSASRAAQGVRALDDIVGAWQSDTTGGTSALSRCVWTPAHGAVLCEQDILTPDGALHAQNLFTFDPATGRYFLYTLSHPGDPMPPVPFTIANHVWTYGGQRAGGDGVTRRTINDFSTAGMYSWRQESTANGREWSAGAHGQSKRLR
jgi:hypothetical protein